MPSYLLLPKQNAEVAEEAEEAEEAEVAEEAEEAEEVEGAEVEGAGVEEGCSRNEPMDGDERGNKENTGDAVRAATTTGEATADGQHHNHNHNINENSISDNDDADDAKEMNGRDTHSEGDAGETAVQQQLDHDASITSLPSLPPHPITTDRDESVIGRAEAAVEGEESSLLISSETDDLRRQNNQTLVEEKEMQRKLMDMESSFVPEPSTIEVAPVGGDGLPTTGADDTYLVGVPMGGNQDALATTTTTTPIDKEEAQLEDTADIEDEELAATEEESRIPDATPEDAVTEGDMHTPTVEHEVSELDGQQEQHQDYSESENARETTLDLDITPVLPSESGEGNTSILEIPASSPTAAAAARTESRGLISATSTDGEVDEPTGRPSHLNVQNEDIDDATPKSKRTLSPAWPGPLGPFGDSNNGNENDDDSSTPASESKRTRPRYLTSRQSIHRFSTSSVNSTTTDTTTSDATLGADYALQSGGAVPGNSQGVRHKDLSRSISLGSMASGISGYSDESPLDKRNFSGVTDGVLHTLDEEDPSPQSRPQSSSKELNSGNPAPETPRAKPRDPTFPPDTVVIDHVKDIQVPATSSFSRQFRENYGPGLTPDKRAGAPTPGFGRSGKNMTLKEQSSTIDRLSKENFDLKMRIHFLNEALNKRSEEGIKEMISENVELKSDKLKLQKENQGLKRTVRDLEKQLKDRDQQSDKDSMVNHDPAASDDEDRNIAAEEEIFYLKERIETYETEIERLRSESLVRESEKRRLAEMVKTLGERSVVGSEVGSREERDMWKDMLDAETAAREQAEEQNRKLRDEILRMKTEATSNDTPGRVGRRGRLSSVVSHSTSSDRELERKLGVPGSTASTLVELELLKQENAELRREVSAQTSMLTSRNREKERLYQEIEDLKLGQRRDSGRSVAGDSIFERSASRAHVRSSSRASDGTRASRASDAERENLEIKNGELRDQLSTLKLENQNVRAQLEECIGELEALDKAYQADVEQAEEEIQVLQQERDQALQIAEEREAALQDLKAEAQEEIDALGDELDQKVDECQRLDADLRSQQENLKALQAEMRSASEGIIRLEEDAQNNLRKYKAVQQELNDANTEIESLEKSLFEANNKVQRLTVQQESSQNEIAFLREEQDGDKIKIGDLESELKTCQMNLQSEKEKSKDLERTLAEERHQREVVGSKEKQEVQKIMNDLNRDASSAKEEARRLKKNLSTRDVEATTWKERFLELEGSLREALGDLNGTRSSLLSSIVKLQKELETTALDLESTRAKLDEKESLLRSRDALLESHGLESRKLADLLDRERQARRADKHSFEQALKSQQQASRTISQNNSRISDLEIARSQDRKRFASLEQQYRDQLSERNTLFLNLWKRLSAMCGPDWAHSNSLINGNLPSLEVIGNILFWPGFNRNLMLAVKTVETMIAGFKNRIKAVERDLAKEYQALENNLNLKMRKLDRLEEAVKNIQSHNRSSSNPSPELSKLRGENRLLKAELNLLQVHSRRTNTVSQMPPPGQDRSGTRNSPLQGSPANAASLARHNTTSSAENVSGRSDRSSKSVAHRASTGIPQLSNPPPNTASNPGPVAHPPQRAHSASDPNQNIWMQRLRELERRLKAEREARLIDRSGARQRLEERDAENEELRAALERERMRKELRASNSGMLPGSNHAGRSRSSSGERSQDSGDEEKLLSVMDGHASDQGDYDYDDGQHEDNETPSSYEGEGIRVDIEV
jgi:hypothetical protein